MKIRQIVYFISILILAIGIPSAEIYKWVDESGVTHYSDSQTRNNSQPANTQNEEIRSPDPRPELSPPLPDESQKGTLDPDFLKALDEIQEDAVAAKAPTVEIYETSWCGYCKKAKNFFRSKGIDFIAYDIEKDQQAARRMMKMTRRRAVPFVVINGQGISGYSEAAYEQALQN